MDLPPVIEKAIQGLEKTIIPHDIVIDELEAMAAKQHLEFEDLSIAMAVYMLDFGSHTGFNK